MTSSRVAKTAKECHEIFQSLQPGEVIRISGAPKCGKSTLARELLLSSTWRMWAQNGEAFLIVSGRSVADKVNEHIFHHIEHSTSSRIVKTLPALAYSLLQKPVHLLDAMEQEKLLVEVIKRHIHHAQVGDDCSTCDLLRLYIGQSHIHTDGDTSALQFQKLLSPLFIDQLRAGISWLNELGIPAVTEHNPYPLKEAQNFPHVTERQKVEWDTLLILRKEYGEYITQTYSKDSHLDTSLLLRKAASSINQMKLDKKASVPQALCIDDCQDLTIAGYDVVKALARAGTRIVLIGNDDESVQGFRGAYPEVLTYLELQPLDKGGLGARQIELISDEKEDTKEDKKKIIANYAINRNTVIRRIARDVSLSISPSFGLSDESLLSRAGKIRDSHEPIEEEDESCRAIIFPSPQDEIEGIINQIKRWRIGKNPCQWNEIAVISHDNSYLRLLGRKCENEGIPYTYSSMTSPLRESPVIQGMLALMKLASIINKAHVARRTDIFGTTSEENNSSLENNSFVNLASRSDLDIDTNVSSPSALSAYEIWQLWATALKSPLFTTSIKSHTSRLLASSSLYENNQNAPDGKEADSPTIPSPVSNTYAAEGNKNAIFYENSLDSNKTNKRNVRWSKIQSVFETIVALMTLNIRTNEDRKEESREEIDAKETENATQISEDKESQDNSEKISDKKICVENTSNIEKLCHYWKARNKIHQISEELPSIESVSGLLLDDPDSGAGELLLRVADSVAGGYARRNISHYETIAQNNGIQNSTIGADSDISRVANSQNDNNISNSRENNFQTDSSLDVLCTTQADIRLLEKAWRTTHNAVKSARKAMKKWQSSSSTLLGEYDLDASITLWEVWDALGLADQWSEEALANGSQGQESNRRLDDIIRLQQRASIRLQEESVESFIDRIEQAQLEADSLAYTAPRPDNIILATPAGSAALDVKNVWIAGVQQKVWPNMGSKGTLFSTDILTSIVLFLMIYGFPSDPESQAQLAVISPTSLRAEVQRTVQTELKSFLVALTRASHATIISAVKSEDTDPSEFIDVFIPQDNQYNAEQEINKQEIDKQEINESQKSISDSHSISQENIQCQESKEREINTKQEEVLVDIPSLVTHCRVQLIDAVAYIVTLAEDDDEEESIINKKKFIKEILEDIANSVQTLLYLAQHNIDHVDSARWMFQSDILFKKEELTEIIESLNETLTYISHLSFEKDATAADFMSSSHDEDYCDETAILSNVCTVLSNVLEKMEDKKQITKTVEIRTTDTKTTDTKTTSEPLSLSPSSVDKIWACPLQWALDNRFSGPSASTSAASFGTIIHLCAQWATENGLDKDKNYSDIDELTQKLMDHYDEILQEHNSQDILNDYKEATDRRVVYKTLRTIAQYFIDGRNPDYSSYKKSKSQLSGVGVLQDSFSEVPVRAEFTLNDILEKLIQPTSDLGDTTWEEVRAALNILCGGFVDENFSAQEKISLHATIDRLELRGSLQAPLVDIIDYKTGSRALRSFTDLQLICYQLALIFDKNAAHYQERHYASALEENLGASAKANAESKVDREKNIENNAPYDYAVGLASRGFLERAMLFKVKTDTDPAPYYGYAENGYQPQLQSSKQGLSREYRPRYYAKNISTFFPYKKELPESVLEEINTIIETKNPHMKGFFARLHYLIQEVLEDRKDKETLDSAKDFLAPESDLLIWALTMLARVFYAASCIKAQNLPAKRGSACGYCQFRPICPAWKEDSRTIYGDVM